MLPNIQIITVAKVIKLREVMEKTKLAKLLNRNYQKPISQGRPVIRYRPGLLTGLQKPCILLRNLKFIKESKFRFLTVIPTLPTFQKQIDNNGTKILKASKPDLQSPLPAPTVIK